MKSIYTKKILVIGVLFFTISSLLSAQNVTVNPGAGSYPTLKDAFDAINAGTHTGAVTVTITGNTVETLSAVLNASGTGAASYTSVLIQPSGARTVTGAIATNLIDLDGADNVTINGLNAAGNSLTISNTATGGANTLRLINDASNNTITNLRIEGSASTTAFGVISFSTGIATGNDNNVVSNCDITGAGANLPINGIFSAGTSAAVANSENTVSGNNIFDFFSAASVSMGIQLTSTGNSAWTITNNRLFQTAPRTYTTANTHQGIFVGSGTGYTVSGNSIGAASAAGTGTYTMNSTVATRFIGIGLGLTAGAPASSLQNNTVYSLAISTSSGASTTNGVLCGINITGGDVNVGTLTGNTIGSMSSTGSLVATPTTTQGSVVGINCSSTGVVNISNNQIGGFTSAGATAAVAGGIFGIIVSGVTTSMTISNNTIGSGIAENMRAGVLGTTTGSSVAAGITLPSSATTLVVSNNTIQNFASYGTGTGGYVRGIFTATTGSSNSTVSGNQINNLTTSSGLTGLTSGNCSALGIHLASGVNALVVGNTVSNIANINTGTTNLIVVGISLAQATNTVATRNRIYNLSNAGTGTTAATPPVVAGIAIRSGTTGVTVDNNMISIGANQTTNTAFVGIWSNHGSTPDPIVNLFHNSVYISGTAASGGLSSFGYLRGDFSTTARTVTVNIKNNIFENVRTGGTGDHYAISNNFGATTASATGWPANASNFNVLNTANPATVAFWTSAQTFAGWQAISAGDGNSLNGASISYTNTSTADLHISTTVSPIDGVGISSFTTTVDFDNQNRNTLTPVDIGADAGNFITTPIISYIPVSNQCFGVPSIVLTASITDSDGVPTSGAGLPVLYWSLNGSAYTPVTGVFTGGGNYSFTFGAGAPNFSTITYYIVAQDNLGNVGSSPSVGAGGFTINPPAAGTPPTIPASFGIGSLGGTYTVGAGGDFTTLTAAVNTYTNVCLTGPVVFSLTDASYSETFPIVINANPNASSVNTLTIKPTGTTTITGSSASSIFLINAADFVIIDGSNGSVANSVCPPSAATRDLTISNTSTSTASAVVWLASAGVGNGATNCTVQNCIIVGSGPAATLVALGAGGTTIGTGGADNDNNRFVNNDVRAAQFGIYSSGASATNKTETVVINQNQLTAATPSNIGVTGIYAAFVNEATVSGNNVGNIIRSGSPDAVGINLGMGAISGIGSTTTGIADAVANVTVTNNIIGAIVNSGTFSAVGITMGNTVSGTQLIANNTVSGVVANGTAGDITAGIWLGGGTGNTSILHNTVNMQGVQGGATSGTQTSTAFGVVGLSNPLTIKNNIFSNVQGGGVSGTTTRYSAISLGYTAPYTGLISNNNDLFSAGSGPGTYTTGITGGVVAGTSRVTLADWQTETAQDAMSLSVLPVFVSTTDLHLVGASNTALTCAGMQTSVASDIDCAARKVTPTIGADELSAPFSATVVVTETSGTVNDGFICAGSSATLTATPTGASAPTYVWSTSAVTAAISVTAAGTYTVTVTDGGCAITATFTISVNPLPTATISGTTSACAGATITLTAGGGVSYLWGTNETTQSINLVMPGAPSVIGVTVTDANGCTDTEAQGLTPLFLPSISVTLTEPTTCVSSDGAINISVTNATPSTYAWTTSGTGSIPAGQQDDEDLSGLPAGTYTVVVTGTNGCTSSAIFTLGIPGGCATCPIIGDVSVSSPRCTNIPVTLTASGLSNLGATYGINFVSFPTTTTNPYAGGTVVATVANGALTSGGAVASTTATLSAGFQYIYAVLTPTPTDPSCRPSDTTSIVVSTPPVPLINVTETSGFSINDGIICQGSSATLTASGGTSYAWSTNAVTAGITVNATGTYTVTVTNAGGCTATATRTITVNPLPTTFTITGGGSRCTTDGGLPVGLSGSQLNVNYQLLVNNAPAGAPVAGTGNAIAFPVQTTGGTYTVVATSTGGCTSSMTGTITISEVNCSASITDPCTCLNNATTLTNGQFGEQIKVNAPSTQTWTVTAINGLFTTTSAAPPAAPTPITVGTVLTNVGGNMFTLNGRHIDAIGYTITVSNGAGTSLSIGNTCAYPNPAITSNLTGPFCLYSDPVTLTGNPGDANIVSQGFTVNGVPATTFNPGAGIGQYTIVYTVNGGVPKANGANDPGCIQSVSTIVAVVATPTVVNCNNLVQVSLDADCSVEVTPDMILEGSYACFDDYEVSIDRTLPLGNGPWATPVVLGVNDIGKTWAVKVTHLVGGNSCWGLIKVEDKMAPVVTCNTIAISCAETNTDPAYLANVLGITNAYPTVVENCSNVTYAHNDVWTDLECPTSPTASSITGFITRTWIVTDASGNTASCTQTINIVGARVYDVNFPADAIISCAANVNTSPSATGTPFITFNYPSGPKNYPIWPGSNYCELQVTYADQLIPVCDGTYKILRTWTAYDWCLPTSPFPPTSNPQYYVQLVKVVDETGPSIASIDDVVASTNANTCCANVDLPNVIVGDACSRIASAVATIYGYDQYTGDLIGTFTVNGSLTTFPGNNLWTPDTLATFGFTPCLPIGNHEVIYTITDDCGNASTYEFELTVEDQTPPQVAADEWTQISIGVDGMAFINAETFDDGSYDNCGPVYFKARRMDNNPCQITDRFHPQVKFCCEDIGDTIMVIFRVYDVDPGAGTTGLEEFEGHYSDVMVQVLVEDKLKPVCVAPANVTVSCEAFDPSLWAYGQATATDNCSNPTITGTVVYTQFDSLCNKGTITRRWTAVDAGGNTSQCTQRIIVTYNQNYWVKFPADRLVSTCDGTTAYGAPEFYGEDCELLATSYTDEFFTVIPDACYKIERTWRVINWCTYNPNNPVCQFVPNPNPNNTTNHPTNLPGVTVSPLGTTVPGWAPTVVRINPTDPQPTNYSTFWNKETNCYTYKQIIKVFDTQDPTVSPAPTEFCDLSANDPQFYNAMQYWDAGIASHDLCEGDANIELTATDACSGASLNFRYLLFLDLDGNGSMETVVNSVAPLAYNTLFYDNATAVNFVGGTPWNFDFRPVPNDRKWAFGLQVDNANGNSRTARVRWVNQVGQNAVPQLPYGNHKIKWFVEDGCGNETVYEHAIVVKDCKKPTVVCLNGLSVNLMNVDGGMIALWASDFLQYTEDNCTPANLIKIGIRRVGQADGQGNTTGFPKNANGTPQTGVSFTCADLGTQLVELWGLDVAGNADYCETYVLIQDNAGVCGTNADIAGALKNEGAQGVEDANVELDGSANGVPVFDEVFSQVTGDYAFSNALPFAGNATVTPTMEIDPLNGVNTWDLILISRHILGLEPLNTPYKLIAADANKSGTVTTFDIVELRKLILGTYQQLPNNSSWRFVDKSQVFTNPANPFADVIRENLQIANIQTNVSNGDFVAAKIGDVDGTATPNNLVASDDRTAGTLLFDIQDRAVTAGEALVVAFTADQVVKGYQFTMNLNGLNVESIEGGAMSDENFAVFGDAVTTSWDAPTVFNGKASYTVTFTATKSGKLSEMLSVSSRITKALAFDESKKLDVAFRFNNGGNSTIAGVGFELYQNAPNPFVNKTFVGFHLPEATSATLSVYDETGRVLYTTTGDFGKGYNAISLDRTSTSLGAGLNANGVLYYKLETSTDSATKKMIQTSK